jgi:hypothetical protein
MYVFEGEMSYWRGGMALRGQNHELFPRSAMIYQSPCLELTKITLLLTKISANALGAENKVPIFCYAPKNIHTQPHQIPFPTSTRCGH